MYRPRPKYCKCVCCKTAARACNFCLVISSSIVHPVSVLLCRLGELVWDRGPTLTLFSGTTFQSEHGTQKYQFISMLTFAEGTSFSQPLLEKKHALRGVKFSVMTITMSIFYFSGKPLLFMEPLNEWDEEEKARSTTSAARCYSRKLILWYHFVTNIGFYDYFALNFLTAHIEGQWQ